jgi:hypothetical protein
MRNAMAKPGDLDAFADAAAALFAKACLPECDNPMFAFWLVIARLCRVSGAAMKSAKGLATARYRKSSTDAFSGPMQWSLTAGTGVPCDQIKGRGVFPFG